MKKPIKLATKKDQELLEIANVMKKYENVMTYWTFRFENLRKTFWDKVKDKYGKIPENAVFNYGSNTITTESNKDSS